MKAIIPVAGVGERLKPFTLTTPKALLPVGGKPILGHILDWLLEKGIDEFILVIGYMGDKIRAYAEKNYPSKVKFAYQEKLLGLGYAVKLGLDIAGDSPVFILLGDTLIDMPDSEILFSNENSVGLIEVSDPRRFGVAVTKDNEVIELEEKPKNPKSNKVLAGVYVFGNPIPLKNALNEMMEKGIKTHNEYQLTDALSLILKSNNKLKWFLINTWYDCGTPDTLLETNRRILEKISDGQKVDGSIIIQPSYISQSAKIINSIIGPYVSIGDEAYIERSIIKNSIVGSSSYLKDCHLDSSIIGNEATFVGRSYRLNIGDSSEVLLELE